MGVVILLFGFLGVMTQLYGIRTMIVLGIAGVSVSLFLLEASGERLA